MKRKELASPLALICLILGMSVAPLAQEDADQYRKEYTVYQAATAEADPVKKAGAILAFMKQFPESTLVQYAVPEYQNVMNQLYQGGKFDEALKLANDFLGVHPADPASLWISADVYVRKQQYTEAFVPAEKLYSASGTPAQMKTAITYKLAQAAVQASDANRVEKYGPEACPDPTVQDCYSVYVELMRAAAAKNQTRQAATYAESVIKGLGAAKHRRNDADWKKYVSSNTIQANSIIGLSSYERQRWSSAISSFQKVVGTDATSTQRSQAQYLIGMSLWKQSKIDPAMEAFAKASTMGTNEFAKSSKKQLEILYMSTHNGSTAGLDEFIQRVTGP